MDQFELLEMAHSKFREVVQRYFPTLEFPTSGYAGPRFHISSASGFKYFKDTPYYYKGELKFVHWTSIEKLMSIINNGEIRLYNLPNSEDKEEFNYAARILELNDTELDLIKSNYFTFSFCKREDVHNGYLWNRYGNRHKGVAMLFSISDDLDMWDNFLISPIYYRLPTNFKEFQAEVNAIKNLFTPPLAFDNDIWKFAGFHKINKFRNEREVRIATFFPFRRAEEAILKTKKEFRIDGIRNRIVGYIPLKLWHDKDSSYLKTLYENSDYLERIELELNRKPKIKIESIVFGAKCGLSNDEYDEFRRELEDILVWRLGYRIHLPLNLGQIPDA
jgi:hypothetical protein